MLIVFNVYILSYGSFDDTRTMYADPCKIYFRGIGKLFRDHRYKFIFYRILPHVRCEKIKITSVAQHKIMGRIQHE